MASTGSRIEEHPDIVALRMRYDRVAENPTLQVVAGLSFLAGLFVTASPWIVGFALLRSIAVSNLITGIAMTALAVSFASAFGRMHGIAWVAPVLGVWTIIAPWAVVGNVNFNRVVVTNVIAGAVYTVLSAGAYLLGLARTRRFR